MPLYPLANFEIQNNYHNEPKFNGVYSIINLPKIKDGAYVINLDGFKSIGTHWIALDVNNKNIRGSYEAIYFDSFAVEQIPKKFNKFVWNKKIIINTYRIQTYDSIMCRYFWIGYIDFMLKDKALLDYTNLFSHNDYERNDKIIPKYFQ